MSLFLALTQCSNPSASQVTRSCRAPTCNCCLDQPVTNVLRRDCHLQRKLRQQDQQWYFDDTCHKFFAEACSSGSCHRTTPKHGYGRAYLHYYVRSYLERHKSAAKILRRVMMALPCQHIHRYIERTRFFIWTQSCMYSELSLLQRHIYDSLVICSWSLD
jgi:hypothetical protein